MSHYSLQERVIGSCKTVSNFLKTIHLDLCGRCSLPVRK